MIDEYTNCFAQTVLIQGRTSNYSFIDSSSCLGFDDCTRKLCAMANNSNVDWTCFLLESSHVDKITHYNNYLFYLLIVIIIVLILFSFTITILYLVNRCKLSKMEGIYYEKIKIKHVEDDDNKLL